MKKTMMGAAALALMMALGLAAQTPAPIKRTPLLQQDLSAPGREVLQALAEFQPGAEIGRHTHPGEEITYVLDGPLLLEIDGTPARTVQTGETFLVPAGAIHNARNAGTGVAKLLVTYVVEKGKPATTPVK